MKMVKATLATMSYAMPRGHTHKDYDASPLQEPSEQNDIVLFFILRQ